MVDAHHCGRPEAYHCSGNGSLMNHDQGKKLNEKSKRAGLLLYNQRLHAYIYMAMLSYNVILQDSHSCGVAIHDSP